MSNKDLSVVFDTETDGLLEKFTKVHVIAATDYTKEGGDTWVFTDEPILGHPCTHLIKGGLREGVEFLLSCKKVCAHNAMQFDWFVLNAVAPDLWNMSTVPPWSSLLQDSLVQSRVQWYDRPCPRGYKGSHGLAAWGKRVGVPKPEIEEWGVWNSDIFTRVVEDIKINAKTKRSLDTEYRKLKSIGVDTLETYNRDKQTSFWMAQQALNGWKADVPLMRKYVAELDETLTGLAADIEPHLPMTIKDKGKITWEDFKEKWEEWVSSCGLSDVRKIVRVPATKYYDRLYKGDYVKTAIKPLANFKQQIWTIEKVNCYHPLNKVTGEIRNESFVKMADCRTLCNKLGKEWKPAKTVTEKKIYDTHVARHFGFSTREYDGYIAAPFTPITFLPSRLTQTEVVKKYLFSCGWVPDDWNYKTDSDNKPIKVCRMVDTKNLITKNRAMESLVEACGLKYIEHDGETYIEYQWSIKKHTNLIEPSLLRTSPKLTESSYDTIEGELGQKIAKYNTLQHRRRTLENAKDDEKGWLNLIREDGRLSAGATVHGTSTGRMTQWGIVNVPSGSAVFGAPMREVWTSEDNTSIVSVDMNSAQLVILCNYMGDEDFTHAVKNGKEELEYKRTEDGKYFCTHNHQFLNPAVDKYLKYDEDNDLYVVYSGTDAHTLNSVYFALNTMEDVEKVRLLQSDAEELHHKVTAGRKKAKNGIYALLFGAGDEKFAKTIKMKSVEEGAQTKQTYFVRLPRIKKLLDKLEEEFKESKKNLGLVFGKNHAIAKGGFVHVNGAYLWVKSPHKLLNYLLMGTEAQIQNEAVNLACRRALEEELMHIVGRKPAEGAKLVLCYHDENSWEAPDNLIKPVKEIADWMYGAASENLNMKPETLVTGTAKVGKNWLEVH